MRLLTLKALALSSTCLSIFLLTTTYSWAHPFSRIGKVLGDCQGRPHWYVGGNLGVSHLFDKKAPGSTNHVDQNGPGWNVDAGYQFTRLFGLEGGFTQYHNSRETLGLTTIAQTEHYAVYLAATIQLYLFNSISVIKIFSYVSIWKKAAHPKLPALTASVDTSSKEQMQEASPPRPELESATSLSNSEV